MHIKKIFTSLVVFLLIISVGGVSLAHDPNWSDEHIALSDELEKLVEEKGQFQIWSIEDQYQWQQDNLKVISSYSLILLGLPNEDDMQRDEAVQTALDAVQREYGRPDFVPVPTIEDPIFVTFIARNEEDLKDPYWQIYLRMFDVGDRIDHFNIQIDAKSGEIILLKDGKDGYG